MTLRGTPYLRLCTPWLAGIAGGACLEKSSPFLFPFIGLLALLLVLQAFRRYPYRLRWVFGACLYVFLFLAGWWRAVEYDERRASPQIGDWADRPVVVLGDVCEAPQRGLKTKLTIAVEAVSDESGQCRQASGRLLALVDGSADSLRYGDRLALRCHPAPVPGPANPDAFDYRRYLHFQNIHYQCFISSDSIVRMSSGHGRIWWAAAYSCRDRLLLLLQRHFPTRDEYAVASALLLGYKEDLSDELKTAYAETGSMHALAVSGSHVGMLYIGLLFLTARLRLRGRWRLLETVLILSVIWAFTFLTGATASVLRASLMFTVYLAGKAFWRNASAWNVLPASAFFLLLLNPWFLFDAGFQLSYAAVAGMVFFYPRLYKWFPPGPRWVDEALKVLLVGVSAQLGTLPLSLYYFHQFPTYFWLAGWLVVLGGALFLWSAAVLILLDAAFQPAAEWLGKALYYMLLGLNKAIVGIQQLPGSVVPDVWISAGAAAALYGAIFFLGMWMVWRKARWLLAVLLVFCGLALYRLTTLSAKQEQRRLVVYQVARRGRLVDFFDGRQAYALADSLSAKQEDFAAEGHRVASGVARVTRLHWGDSASFYNQSLRVDWPLLQFYDTRVACIDSDSCLRAGAPVPVQVLLLSGNARVEIADCYQKFPFQTAVFDATNSRKKTAAWGEACRRLGLPFHDVRREGAWVCHVDPFTY